MRFRRPGGAAPPPCPPPRPPRDAPPPPAVRNGHIKRLTDADIQSSVLEIMSSNVSTTYITTPADSSQTLGIKARAGAGAGAWGGTAPR